MLTIAIGAIALGQAEGVAMALAGGFFGYDAYQEATVTAEERLFQANLEALTDGETGGGSSNSWHCWSKGTQGIGGYWRCGNPCVWVELGSSSGPSSLCHK